MAIAPTRLKALFSRSPTPDGIVRVLAAAGCLSRAALRDRRAVAALIDDTLNARHTDADTAPPMPGPSSADRLSSALGNAGYLSERGQEWAQTIVGPDWEETVPIDGRSLAQRLKAWLARLRS
jgi:hypothetical protein